MARKKLTDEQRRDLDETRRLLYMAKCVSRTQHWELAGTLINAMRHHQGDTDPQLEDYIINALNEGATPPRLLDAITKLS